MDDTWLDEVCLIENLNNLLGDKLWSREQKKMVMKVNLKKEPEEKVT